jgi:hypothetical protein
MKAFEWKLRLIAPSLMICGLIGVGGQPAQAQTVTVSPGSLSFGVPTGSTASAQESVTFSVTGAESSVTLNTVNIVPGTNAVAGDFAIVTDGCSGKMLTAPAACMVGVMFTPSVAAGILESASLNFPFGGESTPTVALTGALGAIKLFGPLNVNPSLFPGVTWPESAGNPVQSTTINLSCPANPTAVLSSAPDGLGNVFQDNTIQVADTVSNVTTTTTNVCYGGDTNFQGFAGFPTGTTNCFQTAYEGAVTNFVGQNPDLITIPNPPRSFVAVYGVQPLNLMNARTSPPESPLLYPAILTSGLQALNVQMTDAGGFLGSATLHLVTNCTPAGVTSGGSITGNPINPNDAGSQTPQFTFDAATGQHIEFDADYLALFDRITANTIPTVTETGLSQETFENLVRGTSAGPAQCIRVKGLLAADGVTPLCEAFTIVCTTPAAQTPAGVNCPQSNARNLLFQTRYDSADKIDIEEGTGPGFLMGPDVWTSPACSFLAGPETGQLCPQNALTEFKGAGDPVHGSTPRGTNSTFIPVLNMPLPFTKTVVTSQNENAWQSSKTVNVKFSASPAKAPEDDDSNGFKAAPIESVTFGTTAANVNVPDTTFPVPGDVTLFNGGGATSACPNALGGVFKTSASFQLVEGRYKLHFFATDCAETEELKFKPSNDPNVNWASFKTVTVKIDTTSPTINNPMLSTTTPTAGQTVTATYSCSDPLLRDGSQGSGVVRCGTFLFFAEANTPTLHTKFKAKGTGLQNFPITAIDLAGNSTTVILQYTVN